MDSQTQMALRNELAALSRHPDKLIEAAHAALVKCDDAQCRNTVLEGVARSIPKKVGPVAEAATAATAGFVGGVSMGFFGPVGGRIENALQIAAGIGGAMLSDSPEGRRVGLAVVDGTLAGMAYQEGVELGGKLAAKVHANIAPAPVPVPAPAAK